MNFINTTTQFAMQATNEAAKPGLLQALGIDVQLLILQSLAFLVLVFLLGKYAYPVIIKSIDKRQEQLDAGLKASEEAQRQANEAEERIAAQIKEARVEADSIVATAHKEASDMVAAAEERAQTKAEHIVAEAKVGLESEITAARAALRQETKQLVAEATEAIIGEKLDAGRDNQLIENAVKRSDKKAKA